MSLLVDNNLWLGTLDSFDAVFKMEEKLEIQIAKALDKGVKLDLYSGWEDDDEDEDLGYQVKEGIAVIPVRGSLIAEETWFSRLFGMSSYKGIQRMLESAIEDDSVNRVILDINSPGGTSEGIDEVGLFIKKMDKIKPVHAYTSGAMNSAAYWIGASCRDITCTRMAQIGSIGVVTVHKDYSKHFKDHGIEVTVFRDGKYKAKPNMYEKLTKEDRTRMDASLKLLGGFFLDWIAQERKFDRANIREAVGEGAVFFGSQGVENGLADKIMFFDDLLDKLIKLEGSNDSAYDSNIIHVTRMASEPVTVLLSSDMEPNPEVNIIGITGDNQMKVFKIGDKEVNLKQLKVLVELGQVKMNDELKVQMEEAEKELKDEAAAAAALESGAAAADENTEGTDAEGAADLSSENNDTDGGDPVLAHVQSQLDTQLSKNHNLELELETLKTQQGTQKTELKALTQIAMTSCEKMSVALGQTPMDLSETGVTALLKQHNTLSEQFSTNFKVGGVSAVETTDTNTEDKGGYKAPLATVKF